jgi:hypothetical protein
MKRNSVLDFLKFLLASMVVGIHGHFFLDFNQEVSCFLQNYLFRVAVPVFLITNGYYFFNHIAMKRPMFEWARKIMVFYVTWSLIYSYWILKGTGILPVIKTVVFGYGHLWYLPATLLAGCLTYLLKRTSDKTFVISCLVAYTIGLYIQYAANYHQFKGTTIDSVFNEVSSYRNFLFFGFPMFGIGYIFAKNDAPTKLQTQGGYFLLIGFVLLALEWAINWHYKLPITEGFDVLLSIPIIGSALFILAVQAPQKFASKIISEVSAVIYFAHLLFLRSLSHVGIESPTLLVVASIAACIIISPVLIWINTRWNVFI